jgi:hypothetical protein
VNKVLVVLGWVFAVLIVLACAGFGYAIYTGRQLDESSRRYVDGALPAILQTWSSDELIKRAAPELRQTATDAQMTAVFAKLSELGTLITYGGASGESNVKMQLGIGTTRSEKLATAHYVAHPEFEKGPAEVTVDLIQDGSDWKIRGFNVNARALRR